MALLLVVDGLGHLSGHWVVFLLICGGAFLVVKGGALPGGDILVLLLGHPAAELLLHLPALLVLEGLADGEVLGVALLYSDCLVLLLVEGVALPLLCSSLGFSMSQRSVWGGVVQS